MRFGHNTDFYVKVTSFEKDKIADLSAEAKRIQKTG